MPMEYDILLEKVRIDLRREEVTDALTGERALIRPQAERLLIALVERSGKVVTKKELMAIVWPNTIVTDDSIVQAIRDIRGLLDDDKRQLVRTVHGQGYRFVPPAMPVSPQPATETPIVEPLSQEASRQQSGEAKSRALRAPRAVLMKAMIAVIAILLLGYALSNVLRPDQEVAHLSPALAVLPFRSSENASLGEWLAEDLVRALARHKDLRVVSSYSSFALRNESLSAAQWQSALDVRYLVDGHASRKSEALVIDVQVTDLTLDQVVWNQTYAVNDATIHKLQQSIVEEIAGTLITGTKQAARQSAMAANEPASLDIYESTQRAIALKHHFSAEATEQARSILDRVIRLDDDYAPAWAARCWINALDGIFRLTGVWQPDRATEVVEQCRRSLALAPDNSVAHLALADALLFAGDLELAASASRRATELAPGDAEAWLLYGFHQLPVRPGSEAMLAVNRANRLFPIKPAYVHLITAQAAWAAAELILAKNSAQSCLVASPYLLACKAVLALVAAEVDDREARDKTRKLLQLETRDTLLTICERFAGNHDRQQQCLTYLLPV